MAKKNDVVPQTDKTYKLTSNAAPLSYMLPTRNTRRFPLLYFDEEQNVNRALRYARNQRSPFEDEQDGNAILEPVIFENGFLRVPRTNPVLQKFLYYHPLNGKSFVEVNEEKDALSEVDKLNLEADAMIEARSLTLEQLEQIARVIIGKDISSMSTGEIRRDVLIKAKRDPQGFLEIIHDPSLALNSNIQLFFAKKHLVFKNNQREVWLNIGAAKRKLMNLPFGENPQTVISNYLQSVEGIETLKILESGIEIGD